MIDETEIWLRLSQIGEAVTDLREYHDLPRIDLGVEVTAAGTFYTGSVWRSLARPTRLEYPTSGELVGALYEVARLKR
jgi:hypothetical protein